MGGAADGDAGQMFSMACSGHRDYIGGGKAPPPTVPPVQHVGALESVEKEASCRSPVRQGGGEEAPTDGGTGDVRECLEGISGIWKTA